MPPILFLDRDGTLIADAGYPSDPARVEPLPGAADALRALVAAGFVPAVVSNQSGLARGLITPKQAAAVHARFVELFAAASGVALPAWYCPHGPVDGCPCRKPAPGLLLQAARELGLIGVPGVIVGDKPSDVAAGRAAGYDGILFTGDWPAVARELIRRLNAGEFRDAADPQR